MTVRDWLPIAGALFIPVVIALGTWRITWQQGKIEDQRAQAERNVAEQRAQDEALQAYLDQMNQLLLDKDLRASDKDSEVRTLARARTLTVLGRLGPSRQGQVVQFLAEADLLRQHIISLNEADLSGANLTDANLDEADLNHAKLGLTFLEGAQLTFANLTDADLGSGASADYLEDHKAEGFTGWLGTDLSGANLSYANLSGANLSDVQADFASLGYADLTDVNLSGAILSNASLGGAYEYPIKDQAHKKLVDDKKLEEQAVSLDGAIMPDGSKHP